MSGGLRAAKRASIPSGYGSSVMSLTAIDGFARWNAWSVRRSAASSTGDEFQCASVIVVFAFVAVLAWVAAAAIASASTSAASTAPIRNRERDGCLTGPLLSW